MSHTHHTDGDEDSLPRDCVDLIDRPGPSTLTVNANLSRLYIEVAPLDDYLDDAGFAPFGRVYPDGTNVTLNVPNDTGGRRFVRWIVDGVPQPVGVRIVDVTVSGSTVVKAKCTPQPWSAPSDSVELNSNSATIITP